MATTFNPPSGPCYSDLEGKTVLVTGGCAGIGRAISLRLAQEGMHVFLCGRTEETLAQTAELVDQADGTATPVTADLSQQAQVASLFERIAQQAGVLDLLVHNAALVRGGSLANTDAEYWRTMLATNLDSAFYLTAQCADAMASRGSGSLIFISTIGAVQAHHEMLAYDTSKGAIDSFVRSMALELAPRGVRVNGIAPGATVRRDVPAGTPLQKIKQPYIPMRRYGAASEIAATVAFLASDQASYITGQIIAVDGGATAQLSPKGIFI